MFRSFVRNLLITGAMAAVVVVLSTDANATWGKWRGSHGSSGGSSGYYSYGSSGSSGSWGSSGGSSGYYGHHRWFRKKWSYGSSGGSWGSHGSHGSYGSYGSYGSSGSSGGSSGGTYYRVVPTQPAQPVDPAPATPPADVEGQTTSIGNGVLRVTVAEDAKIFVNGRETTSVGSQRQYVSRRLEQGRAYTYEVRAVAMRDGREVEETKTVKLRPGQVESIAFTLPEAAEVETVLTVRVPKDSKVSLGGNETNAKGDVRTFKTSALSGGQEWSDYKIAVTVERDGREVTREKVITLKAGDDRVINFDFDTEKIAASR